MKLIRLLCLGDSHLEALQLAAHRRKLIASECDFCIVPGATAVGLRNPNSITDAVSIFKAAVFRAPRDTYVLIQLGEVDCGFAIWYRANKYDETISQQMTESLQAYRKFIVELLDAGYRNICITGAILPTIRDGVDYGDVANARSEIKTSLVDRTKLTLEYNERLNLIAKECGVMYLDFTHVILCKSTNVVDDFYRSNDPADHHLDRQKAATLWAELANQFTTNSHRNGDPTGL